MNRDDFIDKILGGVFTTMVLSGMAQLVSGIAYYLYLNKDKREKLYTGIK